MQKGQNRSSGETRWRAEEGRRERAAAARARAPRPAGNHNPETSSPPSAAARALPARSRGLCQCHGPPVSSSLEVQPSRGKTLTAPSALTSAPWAMHLPLYPSSHFYCPYFSPFKGSSFKPSKTWGLCQSLPRSRPPTTQKEGNDGSQHIPVTVNAAKSWLKGMGRQGLRVLRCSPEPESLLGSLGLKKRKENPDKQAVRCDFVMAALPEAPVALDKLVRTKLSILASLPHRTAVPVAQVWWHIMGDLVVPRPGWPAGKSPWSHTTTLHHPLLLWRPVTSRTLALLMLTQASSSSALLQTRSSESAALGNQAGGFPLCLHSRV